MYRKRRIVDFNAEELVKFKKTKGKLNEDDHLDNYIGVVHYRESKRLLRSPPGYGFERPMKSPVKEKTTLNEGSLFNMCLKFLSMNIHLIDSLIGMPEIIGEQLFSYMIKEKIFNFEMDSAGCLSSFDQLKIRKLALFGEAYNDLLLRSLTLNDISRNFDFMLLLCSFHCLVELDLSGRKLPNGLFSVLSKLYHLEKLILQNNELTDESVVRFTLPYRLYKENPQALEILDIGNNCDITNMSIEFLLTFTSLKTLNLTGTAITMHFNLVYELKQFGWQLTRDGPAYSYPNNVGWAEPVISYLQRSNKIESGGNAKAARFYSTYKENVLGVPAKKDYLILTRSVIPTRPIKFNKDVLLNSDQSKARCTGRIKSIKSSISHRAKFKKPLDSSQNYFSLENDDIDDVFSLYGDCTSSSPKKIFEY